MYSYRPHFDAAVLLRPHEVLPQLDHERIVEIPVHHKKRVQLNSSGDGPGQAELTPSDKTRYSRAARLLTDKPLDPENLGEGAVAFLLRETGAETLDEVQARLVEATGRAAEIIDAALADEGKDEA